MSISRREWMIGTGALLVSPCTSLAAAPPTARLYRQVPRSGERIPLIGLGTYISFDIDRSGPDWSDAEKAVQTFLSGGGALIDTSPMYGNAESIVGELVARSAARSRAFFATKIWTPDPAEARGQVARSTALFRVQPDLVQIHNLIGFDTHLPLLRELKARGRIRYIGATHYHSGGYAELERAIRTNDLDFVQLNYSLAEREAERRILPLALDHKVAVIANRPFAGGGLFGRVRSRSLPGWAAEIGCSSWAQIFLKYVIANSSITCAIPGTRNPRHILDNLGAALRPLPDERQRRRIVEAALNG